MGILMGALGGLGKAGNDIADTSIAARQNAENEERMAAIQEQRAKNLADYQYQISQRPAQAAGQFLADSQTPVPVIPAPVTALDQSGVSATTGSDGATPLTDGIQGSLAQGGAAQQIMQRANDTLKNPQATAEQKADAQGILDQMSKEAASQKQVAVDAVAGQTRPPTMHEALQTAMQKAMASGDTQSVKMLKELAGEKYVSIPDGGLLNTQTGEITEPKSTKATRQMEHDMRLAESKMELLKQRIEMGGGALPADAGNAEWLMKNGVTSDPAVAWKMSKKLAASENLGDPITNTKIATMIATGDASTQTVLGRLPSAQKLAILAEAKEINPNFTQKDYNTQQKSQDAFSTGKQGQAVNSFNVGIAHLGQLSDLGNALENGNSQLINAVGNKITTWTGGAAPTNFDAAKHIVAAELVKAVTGAAGALGDREALDATLKTANSPAQLKGVIDTYKGLMIGQLHGLHQQYEVSTGRKDFYKKLSPESQTLSGITGVVPAQTQVPGVPDDIAALLGKY